MLVLKSAHLYTYIWLPVWNIVTLLISPIYRVHHAKCWAGGSTSWNQECWEKLHVRCADDTTLMAESKEELKMLLMKVKEESEKAGLKLNIQKVKTIESGPITSWQIEEGKVEAVTDFLFWGCKRVVQDLGTKQQLLHAHA